MRRRKILHRPPGTPAAVQHENHLRRFARGRAERLDDAPGASPSVVGIDRFFFGAVAAGIPRVGNTDDPSIGTSIHSAYAQDGYSGAGGLACGSQASPEAGPVSSDQTLHSPFVAGPILHCRQILRKQKNRGLRRRFDGPDLDARSYADGRENQRMITAGDGVAANVNE